ncbi:MAG: D-aminoacyl-tRNA deacylase [Pseudomonadota bacterium]
MRSVVQRVSRASVRVDGEIMGAIDQGLLVLLAAGQRDTERDTAWMAEKITGLRIFEDEQGKMNHSVVDTGGGLLVVSQFTLFGDCRRGKRPSFTEALEPEKAQSLIEDFVRLVRHVVPRVETGRFRAMMDVESVNQGPVTILLDSEKLF